ncbi:DEAD/DEAH box helicase [Actinocatenispora sera]|uniref:Helicase n=1 Tax=Actinocatenispora sera TaxID=390989 RepID=A0A810L3W8_9ACTN|nr:helicase [Actinocatenispora sera]
MSTSPGRPAFADFAADLGFEPDEFQVDACAAVEDGSGVLVCAPTGAGKTVVGEFAVFLALRLGRKCFYTTPIKALSNQKYNDLAARHGSANVGLLTGDNAINPDAPVIVMTTEVLRNMLYAGSSTLDGLGYVVMDEVHYLADRFRGAVWEEVIIHLPASVMLVSLSATVSNAEEFADWLVTVRGRTEVVVSEHRPVPLWQHMLVGRRMFDLFHDQAAARKHEVHPELLRNTREQLRRLEWGGGRRGRPRRWQPPARPDVIDRLDGAGLLPAILFVFSRAGCDAAVTQCLRAGLRLTTPAERAEIRALVEERTAALAGEDLTVLGYWEFLEGLERGLAAHHAGMLPTFKEIVEELFVRGLVKAVFATETLALGINMPARCVVLERLVKYNGEAHVDITPGEYTQLTGRAGRRGIDIEGHAVVLWSPDTDPRHVAGLASTRTYPLRSSFRPSYNMAVNIIEMLGFDRSREVLSRSFAQFQADRSVVGLAHQVQRNEENARRLAERMHCEQGDFAEYFALRTAITERERSLGRRSSANRRAQAAQALAMLRVGDIVRIPHGRRAGLAVVLDPGDSARDDPRPLVLTEDRWAGRLPGSELGDAASLGRIRVPKHFNHRSPQARRDLAVALSRAEVAVGEDNRRSRRGRSAAADDEKLTELRRQLRAHPCHRCPDREDHARWAQRYARLQQETAALQDKVAGRTGSLVRTFDDVCAMLAERGYLVAADHGYDVTDTGRTLARIWSETDLLVAECLRQDVWAGLSAPELAAAASILVYEARRESEDRVAVPHGNAEAAIGRSLGLFSELFAAEQRYGLRLTREPDLGFAWPMYRWARGEPLAKVLASASGVDGEMPAGDFVRWCRQVIDLLEQIAVPADDTLRRTCRQAVEALRRGVVAYTSVG